jgi:hypothetical protein
MSAARPGVGLVITNAPGLFLAFAEWLPLLYLAACPDFDLAARFRTCRVLQKPFHPTDLLEAVRRLSAAWQPGNRAGAGAPSGSS